MESGWSSSLPGISWAEAADLPKPITITGEKLKIKEASRCGQTTSTNSEDKMNEPLNPIQNVLARSPQVPALVKDLMPATIQPMEYEMNPIGMIFGNFKRTRMAKAKELEAKMAEDTLRATNAKLDAVHKVLTFSATVNDTYRELDHKQRMRELKEDQEKSLTEKIRYETAKIAQEVELDSLEVQLRKIKLKKLLMEAEDE
ncbi:hypothetical cytosolic protein [Syntrophus aciditrophicus SB]|uniref:Hypothetical cytosolic protein n=2 Tax=Syntrophus TaxID=43773 RepID=Q2LUZ8_SYNAS|nr:hypothetical cytosolic protein [Syntrophus aciditrophicus SB]